MHALPEKCPNMEFFAVRIFLYSDSKMRTRKNLVFGHFSRNDSFPQFTRSTFRGEFTSVGASIFRGNFTVRGQFFGGQLSSGAIFLGGNCAEGGIIRGAIIRGATKPGDNFPRGQLS